MWPKAPHLIIYTTVQCLFDNYHRLIIFATHTHSHRPVPRSTTAWSHCHSLPEVNSSGAARWRNSELDLLHLGDWSSLFLSAKPGSFACLRVSIQYKGLGPLFIAPSERLWMPLQTIFDRQTEYRTRVACAVSQHANHYTNGTCLLILQIYICQILISDLLALTMYLCKFLYVINVGKWHILCKFQ